MRGNSKLRGEERRELRTRLYAQAGARCEVCGESVDFLSFQLAHRIADSRANRMAWGDHVVDSHHNLAVAHARCNDGANIGGNPCACRRLVAVVNGDLRVQAAEILVEGPDALVVPMMPALAALVRIKRGRARA